MDGPAACAERWHVSVGSESGEPVVGEYTSRQLGDGSPAIAAGFAGQAWRIEAVVAPLG